MFTSNISVTLLVLEGCIDVGGESPPVLRAVWVWTSHHLVGGIKDPVFIILEEVGPLVFGFTPGEGGLDIGDWNSQALH